MAGNSSDASSVVKSSTATLLATGQYSGLTIKCKGRSFRVHKSIVCPASKFFAAAVNGNFKEASTGVVDLEDDEPEIVAHMIDFLYKDDYTVVNPTNPVIPGGQTSSRSMVNVLAKFKDPVITHVKVYLIVDKYDIQPLKKLVCQRYKSNQYEVYCNPTSVSGLQLLYDNTVVQDTMLKRVLLTIAAENADSLWEDDEFRELCTANGAIAFDMLDARLKLSKDPDTLRIDVPECPCCYLTEDVFVEIWSCRSCNCVVGRNSTNTYLA